MIPAAAYRYLAEERKAAKAAKAQGGKGQGSDERAGGTPGATGGIA